MKTHLLVFDASTRVNSVQLTFKEVDKSVQ
jgi:hypothetical protein